MKKLLLSAALLLACGLLQAQTKWYVKSGTSGNGNSWATAGDLQTIINNAASGDSVFVAGGTYQPASGQSFSMKEGVKIYGGFAGIETSLSQRKLAPNIAHGDSSVLKGNSNRVIDNSSNNLTTAAVLDGFSITGGNVSSNGGGMYNSSSSPTIVNCIFSNNSVVGFGGGGMYNQSSSPTITNCSFSNNIADYGGGMYNQSSSLPILTNCNFVGNSSDNNYGGGMYNYQSSSPIITNCTFSNNSAIVGGSGAGMFNYQSSSPTITNCVFWGNNASTGADIDQYDGSFTITYSYTQTTQSGTGNIKGSSDPFVNSSNPAGADGIWSTADDGLELASGSSAIDAGDPLTNTTGYAVQAGAADIANNVRIINNIIDMGAYEYNSRSQTLPVTLSHFMGVLQNGVASLQWQSGVEANFSDYEIQRSLLITSEAWQSLATIAAKGNNSHYTYHALQPEPTAYYRLKMVDKDGSTAYSSIVTLSQTNHSGIVIYPNPASSYINVSVAATCSIGIYDAAGSLVKTQALEAGINTIDVRKLRAGVYYGVVNGAKLQFVKE